MFWKRGWNVLDFFIVIALLLGPCKLCTILLQEVRGGEFSTVGRLTRRVWCLLMPFSAKSEGRRTIRFRMKHDTSSKQHINS